MTKILVVEPRKSIKQKIISALERKDIQAEFVSKNLHDTYEAILSSMPDLVLLDLNLPRFDAVKLLRNIKAHALDIPVILVSDQHAPMAVYKTMGDRDRLLKRPFEKYELLSYINTLVEHRPRELPVHVRSSIRDPLTEHWIPELHDLATGRLDAKMIASYLGISLSSLAEAIGKKVAAVHKNPAASSLQEGLTPIARSIAILSGFFGARERVVQWLNSPHPDLGSRSPLSLILVGKAKAVAEMLEAVQAGQLS